MTDLKKSRWFCSIELNFTSNKDNRAWNIFKKSGLRLSRFGMTGSFSLSDVCPCMLCAMFKRQFCPSLHEPHHTLVDVSNHLSLVLQTYEHE